MIALVTCTEVYSNTANFRFQGVLKGKAIGRITLDSLTKSRASKFEVGGVYQLHLNDDYKILKYGDRKLFDHFISAKLIKSAKLNLAIKVDANIDG